MSQVPNPMLAREFDDFDELAEFLSGWDVDFRQLDTGPFQGRLEQLAGGHTILARGEVGRTLEQRGNPPPGAWTFIVPTPDCSPCMWHGNPLSPGDIAVIRSGGELDLLSHDGFSVFSFSVSETHLAAVAEERAVSIEKLFGDDGMRRGPGSRTQPLTRLLDEILRQSRDAAVSDRATAASHSLDVEATRELVACLSPEDDSTDRSPARLRQEVFHSARAYATSSEEPLTVERLCRVTGTNQRTLYRAFRENCGVSPKAYLKASGLNQVRKLLRRGPSRAATVSAAANRYGFWHMGQLAADYREQFGELPSETLARARLMSAPDEPATA